MYVRTAAQNFFPLIDIKICNGRLFTSGITKNEFYTIIIPFLIKNSRPEAKSLSEI